MYIKLALFQQKRRKAGRRR